MKLLTSVSESFSAVCKVVDLSNCPMYCVDWEWDEISVLLCILTFPTYDVSAQLID